MATVYQHFDLHLHSEIYELQHISLFFPMKRVILLKGVFMITMIMMATMLIMMIAMMMMKI